MDTYFMRRKASQYSPSMRKRKTNSSKSSKNSDKKKKELSVKEQNKRLVMYTIFLLTPIVIYIGLIIFKPHIVNNKVESGEQLSQQRALLFTFIVSIIVWVVVYALYSIIKKSK